MPTRLPLLQLPLLLLAWAATRLSAVPPDFDFTQAPDAMGWSPTHDVGWGAPDERGLGVALAGPDPYLTSPLLEMPRSGNVLVELRIRSESGGHGQLFWFEEAADEARSVHFPCRSNAWTDVCVAIPNPGRSARIRLDPPGARGEAQLAWLRASPVGARGLRDARLRGDSIQLDVAGVRGPFHVVELQPHESISNASTNASVAFVAKADATSMHAIPRRTRAGDGQRDRIASGFVVLEPHPTHGWRPSGPVLHVGDLSEAAPPGEAPPVPASKKGLQVQMVDDAIELGVQHAALNVDLPSLMDAEGLPDSYAWAMDGRTFRFRRGAVDGIPAKALSDSGAAVTLILLAYASGQPKRDAVWLHPGYDPRAPNRLGAFNTVTEEGIGWLRATVEFLCHRFSRAGAPHGRVSHLIVGNEVTAHWHWANMGEVPASVFIGEYERAVRLVNAAAASVSRSIRVHVSLDHHWNLTYGNHPLRAISGRRLVDEFAGVARLGGDFAWHMAYHPYPEDLFKAATWKDQTALPTPATPRITFRNLDVLTTYLGRPELRWQGRPRRVLLSEQGFHSDGTPDGERLQAAAYAYAWHKVDANDGIDAFILHRHVDHRDEGGLNLGLWRRRPGSIADPGVAKPIRDVFLRADRPDRDAAFAFALPVIGITNWSQVRQAGAPPARPTTPP